MRVCKEVLYFDGYIVYWFSGGEFHFDDNEANSIKVEKPKDEYTFLLQLRGEAL